MKLVYHSTAYGLQPWLDDVVVIRQAKYADDVGVAVEMVCA